MKTFSDLVLERFSCRNYLPDPVEDETLLKLLEIAHNAPSAANYQPWHILISKQSESREKINSCYSRDWFKSAPVVLVVCIDLTRAWIRNDGKNHGDIDAAILVDHLTLAATEMGLATCWVCNFDADACSNLLNLPKEIVPVVLIPLGYAVDSKLPKKIRKPLDAIIHWEKF